MKRLEMLSLYLRLWTAAAEENSSAVADHYRSANTMGVLRDQIDEVLHKIFSDPSQRKLE